MTSMSPLAGSLAPFAIPHAGVLGREVNEAPDETRTPFQRDRDRIIHTQAFRRLQGKTQVFVAGEGDHYRTRLTHTMEVAQIGRDVGRSLHLNEDVVEAIALAHDLGHPPFGHSGEFALDAWMKKHGENFDHNAQSFRIVTVLEEHVSGVNGLNVNREILDGLRKHSHLRNETDRGQSLEAQVVNLADEIAYSAHDTEDGLRAGLFLLEDISAIPLIREASARASTRGTSLRGSIIHLLVADLLATTSENIRAKNIRTLEDVWKMTDFTVGFSAEMRSRLSLLKEFLMTRMYSHPRVLEKNRDGQEVLQNLCEKLLQKPIPKVEALQKKTGSSVTRSVADYVAGMTDVFARENSSSL